MSDDEKDALEEIIEKASFRMIHEDDPLFEDSRFADMIRGEEEEEKEKEEKEEEAKEAEQTSLFDGDPVEERIHQAFFGGMLDAYFSLVHHRVITLEYASGILQRPVPEVKDLYDSWRLISKREDAEGLDSNKLM